MPYRRRSRKKRFFPVLKWVGLALAIIFVVGAFSVMVKSLLAKDKAVATQAQPVQIAKVDIPEPDASSEMDGKYYGLCRKKSIRTVEDFRRTVQQDATLSAHFAGFRWENAKVGKLDAATWTFVSYRKEDVIRRTSKPVRLPEGDGYITDGIRTVRTFCCNDYELAPPPPPEVSSAAPADPVERVDDPQRRLTKPVERVDGPPLQLSSGAPAEESAAAIPTSLEKISYYAVPLYSGTLNVPTFKEYTSHKPHPPVATPEPGTFYLLGGGVLVGGLLRLMRRKVGRPDKD